MPHNSNGSDEHHPGRARCAAGFQIMTANQQSRLAVDPQQLRDAADAVLRDSGLASAVLSIAVVDDHTIHEMNRRYLDHDWPTDVLSFEFEQTRGHLEGEVVVSADTAIAAAADAGWPPQAELLLYVIHGTLHLVGYRDKTPRDVQAMRAAEARYIRQFGFEPTGEAARQGRSNTDNLHGGNRAL